ncbi:hypothetical protein Acsp06_12610 [Actinomycetospora sp. NBRC 106375]|nr:hypothetical protein Acsp06_12610 [Actinomycetospora sp. NBRC 106375]
MHLDGHRSADVQELRAAVEEVRWVLGTSAVCGVLVVLGTLSGGDPDAPEILAASGAGLADRLAMLPEVLGYGQLEALWDRGAALDDLAASMIRPGAPPTR